MPKQLQALAHEETMLQATALRVTAADGRMAFLPPLVVTGEGHRFLVGEQLLQVGVQPRGLILEPQGRNTAPAIALAAHWLIDNGDADALMLVMPSDHLIADTEAFREAIRAAVPEAAAGRIVTFGIKPTEPATGYGYIEAEHGSSAVRFVRRFVEKPDIDTAREYVDAGLLWNAGIFLMKASVYLEALRAHAPDVATNSSAAFQGAARDGLFTMPDEEAFSACPSISVDYAVMERSGIVSVIGVDMGWSDVGSWDALWKVTAPDDAGNVLRGAGAMIGCRESLVRNDGGPYVAALGLEDMIVVSTADAVLIAPRERAEEIRSVVDHIEADGLDLARISHEVRRPWGSYRSLGCGEGWQVKRIAVKPGGRLSLQKHAQRAETWVVASGVADVTLDGKEVMLRPGESLHIPVGSVHRLENNGPEPLELIEVQQGAYLGEDDIVRLHDIYGRGNG